MIEAGVTDPRAQTDALCRPRIRQIDALGRSAGFAAVVICDPATLRWLGIAAPAGVRVVISAGTGLVVPGDAVGGALTECGLGERDPVAMEGEHLAAGLAALRAVKDSEEVDRIARAAQLVAVGHADLRDSLSAGASERELWTSARQAIERAAGGPVAAEVDLMTGPRTALVGEPPTGARVKPGDALLFDLAPCREGYWADSCATLACGRPDSALSRRYLAVRAALQAGLEAARPGLRAARLDSIMRSALDDAGLTCPHHTGHGVGTAPQEPPWLVPDSPATLEEGMVIALEPGAYSNGFGVRLEHLVVIEPAGARRLTRHSLSLI